MRAFPLLVLLVACSGKEGGPDDTAGGDDSGSDLVDLDQDGVPAGADCDDTDPWTHPGAEELPYDGVDQDCDGADLVDYDGDGYVGVDAGGDDCMDANPEVNPGAEEVCYNGLDDDCSGQPDTDDCDGDGWGRFDDCDDEDPSVYPGAPDAWYDGVDADCAFDSDFDQDLDGYDRTPEGDDCDDLVATVNPDADEVWNAVDDDCDGTVDYLNTRRTTGSAYASYGDGDAWFGHSLALTADLDGDGRKEVVVGSALAEKQNGRVYLLPSLSGGVDPMAEARGYVDGSGSEALGLAVTVLPDIDGHGELVVMGGIGQSTLGQSQDAYVFRAPSLVGALGGGDALAQVEAPANAGQLDVWHDGDGGAWLFAAADMYLLGAQEAAVWPASLLAAGGDVDPSMASWALAPGSTAGGAGPVPDLDGDGADELVFATEAFAGINAPVVPSADILAGGTSDLSTYTGPRDLTSLNVSFAGGVDWQGDGYQDLLVSDWDWGADEAGFGRIYVIDGPDALAGDTAEASAFAVVEGVVEGGRIRAARAMGDLDDDGVVDLVLSTPGNASGDVIAEVQFLGRDAVAAGGTLSPSSQVPTFIATGTDDQYGWVTLPDDADGDGDVDLHVTLLGGYGAALYFENR